MTEVTTNFKVQDPCGCNDEKCPRDGTLTKHTYKDKSRHIRKCPCAQCRGRKNRKSGLEAQRRAAKRLGVPNIGPMRPSNEENWTGLVRIESKSGAIVKPMWTAFWKAEAQSEASRPHGDNRPFVLSAAVQPQSKSSLIAFKSEDIEAVVYGLAVNLGLIEE